LTLLCLTVRPSHARADQPHEWTQSLRHVQEGQSVVITACLQLVEKE